MNNKLEELKREKKQIQIFGLVVIGGLFLSILLLMRNRPAAVGLFAITAVGYLGYVRRRIGAYKKHVKAANLEECFRSSFKEITYQEKNGLSKEQVGESGMFPVAHQKSILVRDSVLGRYQAMAISLSDVTCDYMTSRRTRQGEEKTYPEYLSGCYFEISYGRPETVPFTLWDRKLLPDSVREQFFEGFHDVSALQIPELRTGFAVYTRDSASMTIPEPLAKAILRLAEYTPGEVAVQVDGTHCRIFIHNRFTYTRQFPVRAELTSQMLQHNQFPEIHYILRVVDALKES